MAERPLRVLYLHHPGFVGGAARTLLSLWRSFDRQRVQPLLGYHQEGPFPDHARELAVPCHPLPLRQLGGVRNPATLALRLATGIRSLLGLIQRERVDVVQSNVPRSITYGVVAAKLAGVPFVWHIGDIHRPGAYVSLLSRWADAIVPVSQAVATVLPPSARSKARVIYTGIDLTEFDSAAVDRFAFRRELGLPDDAPLVGDVAWIAPWKGHETFLEATQRIFDCCPKAHFAIVGGLADPAYRAYGERLQALAAQMLPGRVSFTGPRSDVAQVVASFDLLLHPASDEPLGLALVEAMALGVPVLAFGSGGTAEVVANEKTGLLAAPGDVEALAEKAVRLLGDEQRRSAMALAARERACELFDARKMASQMEQLYRELSGSGRSVGATEGR